MNQIDFGKYFADLRVKSGFKSQRRLAKAAGLTHSTISKIEDGSKKVKPETLKTLSQFLVGTSYGELLKKAGYLDDYSFSEQEDQMAKADFMEVVEILNEDYIRKIMKNNTEFYELDKDTEDSFRSIIGHEESITPESLLRVNRNSNDLSFKVQLNEKLSKIIQSNPNTFIKDFFEVDNSYIKRIDKVLGNHVSSEEMFTIVEYINKDNVEKDYFEIVDTKLLNKRSGFAYKVVDTSMKNEGIYEGDTLICVKESYLSTSNIGIIIDDIGRLLMRKVKFHDNFLVLTSSDNDPELVDPSSITIIGKVIQIRRKLD
jgi:transcriptional regulator with XRE-family HTH domain